MAKQGRARRNLRVIRGSGNVFRDLELPDAEELQTRVRLAVEINRILAERGLSQTEAARLLGLTQPKVSALANYRLRGFSAERLLTALTALNRDVTILISARRSGAGRIRVDTRPTARERSARHTGT